MTGGGAENCCSGDNTRDTVKDYYGKQLKTSDDLKTDACCTAEPPPPHIKEALKKIHPEVISKYYGCGLVIPDLLEGARVLDLGCGAGRDCYIAAQLVGETGSVVGIDMTQEQLDVARAHVDWHAKSFGFKKSNTEFKQGYIEKLGEAGLEDNTFDVIISNCVVNLSPDKAAVLREAYRVLKVGGEMYFSDVYADRRVPESLVADKVLYGECLSGALYWNDFLALARRAGFADPRLVKAEPIGIRNRELQARVGPIRFTSATFRLFKLPTLEPNCEDYGQAVMYKGTVPGHPHSLTLDKGHKMETGRMFTVCGNTDDMLRLTRFRPYFDFFGGRAVHYGVFPGCGTVLSFPSAPVGRAEEGAPSTAGSCC